MGYVPLPPPVECRKGIHPWENIVYDHSWQDPKSHDYDPLRVIKETPDMKNGRVVVNRPAPPPPPPPKRI